MNRCPITYEEIAQGTYSRKGLNLLSRELEELAPLLYTAEEQRVEAARRAAKMSIQGVQPKLSARVDVRGGRFEFVDTNGRYILKPPSAIYAELPQNEDLTMRLASAAGIEVPLHGMVYARDGSLTYFVKRFDRSGHKAKLALEDFAQLLGKTRDTKYDASMEQVVEAVREFCTFPAVENVRLFRLTLFNYLTGNEDMHLKNFSLIRREGKMELSPAYDLLNTTMAIGHAEEEMALPLHGKKRHLTATDLIEYFGGGRLGLPEKMIHQVISSMAAAKDEWFRLINISFLSDAMKDAYMKLLATRWNLLGLNP